MDGRVYVPASPVDAQYPSFEIYVFGYGPANVVFEEGVDDEAALYARCEAAIREKLPLPMDEKGVAIMRATVNAVLNDVVSKGLLFREPCNPRAWVSK
jgi:hypothetical protein